ncbi:MAG: hypothetical protein Hyperionvirus28_28 [Hyperionvirus sp.]|uniref:Uncharacterized protein n=1 Tax=Hyperionvirus sp. TaxID=2487770 RepID=A0A3G5ABF5_9VIRU|nr:MAG: hypothetical protein Hyperionvirus28_28 [Hyperionvirus sp.]
MDYKQKYKKYKIKYRELKRVTDDDKKWAKDWGQEEPSAENVYNEIMDKLTNDNTVLDANYIYSIKEQIFGPVTHKKYNPESSHRMEDIISIRFLQNIVDGKLTDIDNIKKISEKILEINNIPFERWYS